MFAGEKGCHCACGIPSSGAMCSGSSKRSVKLEGKCLEIARFSDLGYVISSLLPAFWRYYLVGVLKAEAIGRVKKYWWTEVYMSWNCSSRGF